MANEIEAALKRYLAGLKSPDGTLNIYNLFEMAGEGSFEALTYRDRIVKLHKFASETYDAAIKLFPGLDEVNKFELGNLHALSEFGFPYWMTVDYFNYPPHVGCSERHPLLCLPPDVLALILAWQQVMVFAVIAFLVLLIGGVIGVCMTRRGFTGNRAVSVIIVLVCFTLDVLGLISMLVPIVGNLIDIVWAPISGLLVGGLLRSPKAGMWMLLKEIIPLGDMIPLATIMALAHAMGKRR